MTLQSVGISASLSMRCILYYIHDPMCSWCYAFEAALQELRRSLPEHLAFRKIVGGLAPDTEEPMPTEMRRYVQRQWQLIEEQFPHIRFNFAFWNENIPIRSSYPACRAVLAAKRQGLPFEDNIIANIQRAYYLQAENPALTETLLACAQRSGLELTKFAVDFISPEINEALLDDLRLAKKLAVSTFPSLRLYGNGRFAVIECRFHDVPEMLAQISTHESQL